MNILLFITIWLIGAILCYPRMNASLGEFEQKYKLIIGSFILSWLGVLAGIIVYLLTDEETFWKWK